jgi:uncharacterized protein with HEPN domain
MRKAALYLKDILEALDSIQAFTAGLDMVAFQEDDKTLSAVIRKFEIIGEAAKGPPSVIREQYPGVPWKEIHGYSGVDSHKGWMAVRDYVPTRKILIVRA